MAWLDSVNSVLWHDSVLYTLLGVGILFTLWSGFGQYRALSHGVSVIRGRYDRAGDPGAISHVQALSAALSATVGLACSTMGIVIVPAVAWLFAFSTMISWSYYGEQGAIHPLGPRSVMPYRVVYCLLILVATSPLIRSEAELDTLSSLGTGVMLFANIPIMLLFGRQAMRSYHDYLRRLDAGEFRSRLSRAGVP